MIDATYPKAHRTATGSGVEKGARSPGCSGDRGYDAARFGDALQDKGRRSCIPPASPVGNSAKSPPDTTSDETNAATRIEIVFGRPKDWRPGMARAMACSHPLRPMPKGSLLGDRAGCNCDIPALKRNVS